MLLTMGVRDCPEQVEVYNKVMEAVRSGMQWGPVKRRLRGRLGEHPQWRLLLCGVWSGGHRHLHLHLQSLPLRDGSRVAQPVPDDILSSAWRSSLTRTSPPGACAARSRPALPPPSPITRSRRRCARAIRSMFARTRFAWRSW